MTTNIIQLAFTVGVVLVILSLAGFLVWMERRLLALWQDRYGPNRVGPLGLLQIAADIIKLFSKEDWIPPFADKVVFVLAPAVIAVTVLLSFSIIPFAPGWVVSNMNIGLLFFLAMSSLGVYSIVLAGWASDNKYALLGGLRASAQMFSYEVFMALSLMGTVLLAGSFNLTAIVEAQRRVWFVIPQFFGFILFLIAGIAETRRIPFDLPEAESEHRPFFRRLAGTHSAAGCLVFRQNVFLYRFFHSVAGRFAAPAVRPADVLGMEIDAAAHPGESAGDGRGGGRMGPVSSAITGLVRERGFIPGLTAWELTQGAA